MKYDIDYFIKKFEQIPSNRWCTGKLTKGLKHCAVGHCESSEEDGYSSDFSPESMHLMFLVKKYLDMNVADINDGKIDMFKKKKIKDRILAALYYCKRKECSK